MGLRMVLVAATVVGLAACSGDETGGGGQGAGGTTTSTSSSSGMGGGGTGGSGGVGGQPSGEIVYAITAGHAIYQDTPTAVAAHGDGRTVVVGDVNTLQSGDFTRPWVRYLDDHGTESWLWELTVTHNSGARDVAVHTDGSVAVTGVFIDSIDFGSGPVSGMFSREVFVMKLSAAGDVLWAEAIVDDYSLLGWGVSFDHDGDVLFSATLSGEVTIAGLVFDATPGGMAVAKLDGATGAGQWATVIGEQVGSSLLHNVACDSAGNVVVTGSLTGTSPLGGGLTTAGQADVLVAKLSPDGAPLWAAHYGDDVRQDANAVAIGPDDSITVGGDFAGTLDFGGDPLTSAGARDAFLVRFDSDGNHLWSARFGDDQDQTLLGLDVDATGAVVATGGFFGAFDLGGDTLMGNPPDVLSSSWMAKLDPDGAHLWSYGGTSTGGFSLGRDVAMDGASNVYVLGLVGGEMNIGDTSLTSTTNDVYLLKLTP